MKKWIDCEPDHTYAQTYVSMSRADFKPHKLKPFPTCETCNLREEDCDNCFRYNANYFCADHPDFGDNK